MRKYQLYLFDVWGNWRDGYEINNWYPASRSTEQLPDGSWSILHTESVIIELHDDVDKDTDHAINRKLKIRGIQWADEGCGQDLNGRTKSGKPFGFLRPIE